MKLYGYWRSSSAWRVRIGLHLKGLAFEYVPVHLREGVQRSDAHRARNPLAQVPVLEVQRDGAPVHLTQSLAILAWLDASHPEPALIPDDPWDRARAWQLAEMVNAGIQPLQNFSVLLAVESLGGERAAWARDVIERGLLAMESLAGDAPFLVGDTPTIADLCLVPQLYNARRFGVDMSQVPGLLRVEASCEALAAFQAAHPSRQPDAE